MRIKRNMVIVLLIFICGLHLFQTSCLSAPSFASAAENNILAKTYAPGINYYAEDAYNTKLANLLFKKNYTSVSSESVDPGRMNSNYDFLAKYVDKKTNIPYLHKGMDFKATKPTLVYSPISGIVLKSTPNNGTKNFTKDYGVIVIYDSVHDCSFNFQHLSEKFVSPGEGVNIGQLIGKSGKVGADGYHLHVGLRAEETSRDGLLDNKVVNNYDPRIVTKWGNAQTKSFQEIKTDSIEMNNQTNKITGNIINDSTTSSPKSVAHAWIQVKLNGNQEEALNLVSPDKRSLFKSMSNSTLIFARIDDVVVRETQGLERLLGNQGFQVSLVGEFRVKNPMFESELMIPTIIVFVEKLDDKWYVCDSTLL